MFKGPSAQHSPQLYNWPVILLFFNQFIQGHFEPKRSHLIYDYKLFSTDQRHVQLRRNMEYAPHHLGSIPFQLLIRTKPGLRLN